jgi:hypothetical protein
MRRTDPLTNENFIAKRINQRFAKAANRIKFYNIKAKEFRHSTSYINKPLNSNIKILQELMVNKDEAIYHKQYLLGRGYSIGIHSHVENYQGKNQFAIHNFILMPLENEQIKIIRYKND